MGRRRYACGILLIFYFVVRNNVIRGSRHYTGILAIRSVIMFVERKLLSCALLLVALTACEKDSTKPGSSFHVVRVFVGVTEINLDGSVSEGLPPDRSISIIFSLNVDTSTAGSAITLTKGGVDADIDFRFPSGETVLVYPRTPLDGNATYTVHISSVLKGANGESILPSDVSFITAPGNIGIVSAAAGGSGLITADVITDVPLNLDITLNFSAPANTQSFEQAAQLTGDGVRPLAFSWMNENRTVRITTTSDLLHFTKYRLSVGEEFEGMQGEAFDGFSKTLYTGAGTTPQFPVVPDDELLTLVQRQTFKYFWDFAHPVSGMARERNTSGDIITSGGSGFGMMSLIVGIERSFISRDEGLQRMDKILSFLENAERFRGAWSHWINGNTGKVIPFSANDNGGDLVETSFLVQGLLTFRQYLDAGSPVEKTLIDRINALWHGVEWNWYTRGGENVLYWHWSPDKQWTMNHQVRGYNEALITYLLAAASPTYSIDASVYHNGWARNGAIRNNKNFYGIALPLGEDYGGPLFFAHYSFLGFDPRGLQDAYANYWTQNVNHSKINHAYSIDNPKQFVGYGDAIWGLTASDNHEGYSAHSPTNDLGVITPSAALSSFPYTPEESMVALKFFYYTLGDRLWGPFGFYDAFNITEGWTADSYLAIDQGPIIIMIENYRTGLLWDLFMSCPEVEIAMEKLGFTR